MEYKIARRETLDMLEVAVNNAISEGWRCQGGISFQACGDTFLAVQAMIRKI